MSMKQGERSYRELAVSILETVASFTDNPAKGDILNAARWLESLSDSICPKVTDEELTEGD